MTTRAKTKKKALANANKTATKLHPALDRLVERLSSPRLRAPGTLSSYLVTGSNFLSVFKSNQAPTDSDFRQYFIRRRRQGISERTLRKEFFHLQKLAKANQWPWPFDSDDTPYDAEPKKLPFLPSDKVKQLIAMRGKLTNAECFYLAVATTWIVRREELSRIKKLDFDAESFLIHVAKHGKNTRHLIPDVLKPIFAAYRPKEHNPSALSLMFKRICAKAGVDLEPRQGWHSIRYTLNRTLEELVPRRIMTDFSHWKTVSSPSSGEENRPRGGDMIEHYRRPEILHSDPYYADRIVYAIHPFLPLWQKKP